MNPKRFAGSGALGNAPCSVERSTTLADYIQTLGADDGASRAITNAVGENTVMNSVVDHRSAP